MDKIKLSFKNQLLLLGVILLIGVGLFWRQEIRQFVLEKKQSFLTAKITPKLMPESEESVNIILPEQASQPQEKQTGPKQEIKESESGLPVSSESGQKEPESDKLIKSRSASLVQVQEQVKAISSQVTLISQKVNKLTEQRQLSSEKHLGLEGLRPDKTKEPITQLDKSAQLSEIEQKISQISQKVKDISEIIAQMNKKGPNITEKVAQI